LDTPKSLIKFSAGMNLFALPTLPPVIQYLEVLEHLEVRIKIIIFKTIA